MKTVRTWILLASANRARVVLHEGPGHGVSEVAGLEMEVPAKQGKDIMADKPGRSFDSAGTGRHGMEMHTDPVRVERARFADEIVAMLEKHCRLGEFDRLAIVASPGMLGDLRKAMPKQLAGRIHAEVAKDLTAIPNDEVPAHLADLLAA